MPVIFKQDGFRFFFYSDEGDPREPPHVHARNADGEAKFWLRPNVRHARSRGPDFRALRKLAILIEARRDEIEDAWNGHFS
ncbi:DUF4160 domain-containing protein [Sphingomonas sp. AAP5]|uniref:DUF4160 domain-containing protein n=1 Tax=Sphingomonas sp. AAP5 TaxID=1523415 RepID=UPI0010574EDD|nr:DUF4160 domain-containing protein [Sphingomonas sp. AAP5]QBM74950.1 DUF4160 domain-containing protein [Sphingomonas sp. AAP5]